MTEIERLQLDIDNIKDGMADVVVSVRRLTRAVIGDEDSVDNSLLWRMAQSEKELELVKGELNELKRPFKNVMSKIIEGGILMVFVLGILLAAGVISF